MLASAAGAAMADFVSTAGSGIIATGATVAVGLAYRAVRPYFKAAVNCHFCNTDCKVTIIDYIYCNYGYHLCNKHIPFMILIDGCNGESKIEY